ncbi:MAG: sigma factor-like helix-turn-helix DNA-binding protein [Oscillospiraceae bacterium]
MLKSDELLSMNMRKSETARRDICRGIALGMADNESDTEVIELVADETSLADFERIYKSSTAEILCRAVDRLPDELKSVIYCRYYKELTFEQTAHKLGITHREAVNRERRALKQLRYDKELYKLADEYTRLGLL